ncbi:MAG: hypothetical protein WBB28_07145 [Crinalium sp.]
MKTNKTFLMVLCLSLSVCLALNLIELALGVLAIVPLILLMRLALLDNTIESRLLSITYSLGQVICWVIGFLGCVYILAPFGYEIGEHTITTMILINLVTWGSLWGSLIALPLSKKKAPVILSPLPENLARKAVPLTGIIFFFFLIANYASGYLTIRTEIGVTLPPSSPLYFLTALSILQYVFFFVIGTRLYPPLLSKANITYISILLICAIIISMTGGRELSLRIIIYFIAGSLYSKVEFKSIRLLVLGSLPLVLAFIVVIGIIRGNEDFQNADFNTRLQLFFQAGTGQLEASATDDEENPFFTLFTRMTEPTGQLVIDNVAENHQYIGFENFERIGNIFIPKFITGDKVPLDDGGERLRDNYGVYVNEFTVKPITFMADCFERGGYMAVFISSVLLSTLLTTIGNLIYKLKDDMLKLILNISLSYGGLRIYAFSVLGTVNLIFYQFLRDTILISFLIYMIRMLSNEPKRYHK